MCGTGLEWPNTHIHSQSKATKNWLHIDVRLTWTMNFSLVSCSVFSTWGAGVPPVGNQLPNTPNGIMLCTLHKVYYNADESYRHHRHCVSALLSLCFACFCVSVPIWEKHHPTELGVFTILPQLSKAVLRLMYLLIYPLFQMLPSWYTTSESGLGSMGKYLDK